MRKILESHLASAAELSATHERLLFLLQSLEGKLVPSACSMEIDSDSAQSLSSHPVLQGKSSQAGMFVAARKGSLEDQTWFKDHQGTCKTFYTQGLCYHPLESIMVELQQEEMHNVAKALGLYSKIDVSIHRGYTEMGYRRILVTAIRDKKKIPPRDFLKAIHKVTHIDATQLAACRLYLESCAQMDADERAKYNAIFGNAPLG